jgi:hypothetical protein
VRSLPRLLLVLAAAGCAPATSQFVWETPQANVRSLTAKYPRAVAVILKREDRLTLTFDHTTSYGTMQGTKEERHDVIAILAEGGDRFAEVAVPVGDGRLTFLHARTISADGRTQEVTPEEVHTAVARTGSGIDGMEVAVKVFRLPGVHVGSIIEYAYGIANERLVISARRAMSADVPIVHYHSEIELNGGVEVNMRIYNGHPTVGREDRQGLHIARLDQYDIPARVQELFAPPPSVTEPAWAIALTKIATRGRLVGLFDSWSHALAGMAEFFYEKKGSDYASAALKPSLQGCGPGLRCAVERAVALVDDKTELSRFVIDPDLRPLKEVLASGLANSMEKALLLRSALAAVHVNASYAWVARDLDRDFDPKFPSSERFDHLLVRVDQQPGIDTPLFIDPSCDACSVGQLPQWSNYRQALAFGKWSASGASSQPETPVDIVQLNADEAKANVHRQMIDATLDPNGTISGRISDEFRGEAAVEFRIKSRSWLDDRWRTELESDLHARAPTAALRGVTPAAWDKREARLTVAADFSAPSYAAADGKRQIVPLSFLHMAWDRDLPEEPRRHDVMVRNPEREEETIVFHLPKGWTATDLPHAAVWQSEALNGAVQVTSSPGTVTIRRIVQTRTGHWGPGEIDDLLGVVHRVSAIRQAAFAVAPAP